MLYQASGNAVALTVCVVLCLPWRSGQGVRFNYSVRKWRMRLTLHVWSSLLTPYCQFRVMSFLYRVVESFLLDSCNPR